MSLSYGQPEITSIVYSSDIRADSMIKVNKKKIERKSNDDLRLLFSEMNFIHRYVNLADRPVRIIYIGAAPGFHLIKLLKLYDFLSFDLYDDQELHIELQLYIQKNSDQVRFFKEKFTVETCARYSQVDEDLYLITDFKEVRFMQELPFTNKEDYNVLKEQFQADKEISYAEDMQLQKEICKNLPLVAAFLRFRPSHFYEGKTAENAAFDYFNGVAWLMIYGEINSVESRLAVTDFTTEDYKWNIKNYQYRLNHFNAEMRESLLLNPFTQDTTPLPHQLGNKFETIIMIKILMEYLNCTGYLDPRVVDVVKIYKDFIVLETCSNLEGFLECSIKKTEDSEDTNYDDELLELLD